MVTYRVLPEVSTQSCGSVGRFPLLVPCGVNKLLKQITVEKISFCILEISNIDLIIFVLPDTFK